MTIRTFILATLLAFALPTQAHECDPLAINDGVMVGTAARTVTTPAGSIDVWWCKFTSSATPPGMVNWRQVWIASLNDCRDMPKVLAAMGRIASASAFWTQLETEVRAAGAACVAVPDTPRYYDWRRLRWLGCREAVQFPPPGTPPDWLKPIDAPATWVPVDWCGPEPKPPVTTEVWTTPALGTFRLYTFANGKLLAAIAGRTAGPNQLGNCAVTKIASGTSIYCPVASGSQAEVTLMKRVQ